MSDEEIVEFVDYPTIGRAYAEAVVDRRVSACRLIISAAQRYLDMLALAAKPGNEFYFSPQHVIDYCSFNENLVHPESGRWEITQRDANGVLDQSIILEPWQIWIECAIHGFRKRLTHERLVTTVLEMVPRKNAKTERLASAALFDLCCSGQIGAQIPLAGATAKQLEDSLYGVLLKMLKRNPALVEHFDIAFTSKEIKAGEGRIFMLTSQGERQDGLNPSLAIFEEGHSGAESVYKVVMSAFGARPNALLRMITTAGYRPEGPGYQLYLEAKMMLEGKSINDSMFAAIYTLDPEDYLNEQTKAIEWDRLFGEGREALIAKANPMYGIGLDPSAIAIDFDRAKKRPDLRGEVARTRFDIWTSSGTSLISLEAWMACRRDGLALEQFVGHKCWIGVDLASVMDMCAIGLVFEIGPSQIAVFARFFLPEESPTYQDPDLHDTLSSWADAGYLTLTPGTLADHELVREEVSAYCEVFDVAMIACDPKQAHTTVKYLYDGQRPIVTYNNNQITMTAPTDDIIGKVAAGTIAHDGNPVLAWNVANVHGDRRGNGLILPRKDKEHSTRKIDGFVAICMANGVRLAPQEAKEPEGSEKTPVDPYLNRGLLGYEDGAHDA